MNVINHYYHTHTTLSYHTIITTHNKTNETFSEEFSNFCLFLLSHKMVRGILIHGPESDKRRRTTRTSSSDTKDTLYFSAWFDSECNKNKKSRETYILNAVRERCTFERNSFSLLSESERSKLPSFMEEEDEEDIRVSMSTNRTSKDSTPRKSHVVRFSFVLREETMNKHIYATDNKKIITISVDTIKSSYTFITTTQEY